MSDPKTFTLQPSYQRVEKPWGYEIVWTPEKAPAVGKFLHVNKGKRLSLQWHDQKTETLCLMNGKALFILEDDKGVLQEVPMAINQGYFVQVGQKHRIMAVEDSTFVESSTPETGNTFRLEDDYSRPTETEELRSQENRGWSN